MSDGPYKIESGEPTYYYRMTDSVSGPNDFQTGRLLEEDAEEVCDRLNAQHAENKALRDAATRMAKYANTIRSDRQRVTAEIERLKRENIKLTAAEEGATEVVKRTDYLFCDIADAVTGTLGGCRDFAKLPDMIKQLHAEIERLRGNVARLEQTLSEADEEVQRLEAERANE